MIPPAFLHDLLARADIVELIGRHVQLKKAGATHKGLCPFHGEKTPSFTVSATRQTYHCFGCGVHGNAIGFLMEHAGMSFPDAVRDLAQQVGMPVPEDEATPEERQRAVEARQRQATLTDVLARAAEHYRKQLKASPRAVDYLKARGLSGEIAAQFGLGYAPEGWRGLASVFPRYDDPLLEESGLVIAHEAEGDGEAKRYDRFRDRIMFPIRSVQGDVIGFGGRVLDRGEPKYLNSPETPVFVKGRELYGLHEARAGLRLRGFALVVEGYMDVVALAQLGFPNAVATLGTACTAEHVQKLFRFTDAVMFSFDGDAAGRKAAGRALEAALPHATDTRSVRFLFLPPEHDPDSFVRAQGAPAFERLIAQAVPLSRQLVEAAREGCDMASAEGRARLLANARPLWSALPDGALKRQLLAEIAQAAALPADDLADLWQVGRPAGGFPAAPRLARPPRNSARPRSAPASRADHALRMLLLHSEWWDALEPADHELLHALPAPHGDLCAWLERHLSDHGATPWSALDAALAGSEHAGLAAQLVTAHALADDMALPELQSLVDRMWIERLASEMAALSRAAETDAAARERLRELGAEQDRRRKRADAAAVARAR
ncbi:MAG: DNA primase [Ideonella sp.]|nr:DNA primase [Ideonella sp.]